MNPVVDREPPCLWCQSDVDYWKVIMLYLDGTVYEPFCSHRCVDKFEAFSEECY